MHGTELTIPRNPDLRAKHTEFFNQKYELVLDIKYGTQTEDGHYPATASMVMREIKSGEVIEGQLKGSCGCADDVPGSSDLK